MLKKRIVITIFVFALIFQYIGLLMLNKESITVSAEENTDVINNDLTEEFKEELLYGYNILGGYDLPVGDALSKGNPIIKMDSPYYRKIRVFKAGASNDDGKSYNGYNHNEVIKEYARNEVYKGFGNIYVINAEASVAFKNENRTSDAYTEWYDIYTIEKKKYYTLVQELDLDEVRECLTDRFKKALYAINTKEDAKDFFNTYGTHLNTGYYYGGRLIVTNYKASTDRTVDYKELESLSADMGVYFLGKEAGASANYEEDKGTHEKNNTDINTYRCKIYGGDAHVALSIEDLFQKNTAFVNKDNTGNYYTSWENSVNDEKNLCRLAIPNNAKSIPLWELLDPNDNRSTEIYQTLVNTYIELCGEEYNKYLELYPDITRGNLNTKKSTFITITGAYVKTPGSYYYSVDPEDFNSDGDHYGIHKYEYIYLTTKLSDEEKVNIQYSLQNCEVVDPLTGIFSVTGNSGKVIIKAVKDGEEQELINLPILSSQFEGGMGNSKYPYIITNTNQFRAISSNTNASYILMKDLNFEGEVISSLGDLGENAVIDGNYCSLSNFRINSNENWGLFGINEGTIKNLKISDAGTSLNNYGFFEGGKNYYEDYEKDNYTIKSIDAKNAGLICAINRGEINNCYLNNTYIRNIIKNTGKYLIDKKVQISSGVIAGINDKGYILNCMVSNSCILDSYISTEANNIDCYVYSGGLVGLLKGGKIENCVYDSGLNGTLMAQGVIEYDNWSSNTENGNALHIYSGGIAGFCNENSSVKSIYSYVRETPGEDSYKAIDAEYRILDYRDSRSKNRHALRSATMVCDDNCSVDVSYAFAYSSDSGIPIDCIFPTDNGGIRKDDQIYDNRGYITSKIINNSEDFNSMRISKSNFCFDNYTETQVHVKHILKLNRSEYVNVYIDKEDQDLDKLYYKDEAFFPKSMKVKVAIRENEPDDAKVFRIEIKDTKNFYTPMGLRLSEVGNNTYAMDIYIYGDEKKCRELLSVDSNYVIGLKVNPKSNNSCDIYFDEIDEYRSTWNANKLEIYKIMKNGEEIKLSSKEMEKVKSDTITDKKITITKGENRINVQFTDAVKGNTVENYYILNVKERELKSISVVQPEKLECTVGRDVDLSNVKLLAKYNEGNDKTISVKDYRDKFELIGNVSKVGENKLYLVYNNYGEGKAELVVNGITSEITIPTNISDDPEPSLTVSPTPDIEVTITPTLTPSPTVIPQITNTPTPTSTPIPTSTPTPTPIPEPIPEPTSNTGLIVFLVLTSLGLIGFVVYKAIKKEAGNK